MCSPRESVLVSGTSPREQYLYLGLVPERHFWYLGLVPETKKDYELLTHLVPLSHLLTIS